MTEGRRERKKAATRKTIAATALRLFLERGYDDVGIREVAEVADVAVTTVFAHFPSKEALVFDRDADLSDRLVAAAADGSADAFRAELHAIVLQFARPEAAPFWALVDSSADLRNYLATLWLRHEEALALALEPAGPSVQCRAFARFVLGVYPLARQSPDPPAAVDAMFDLITPGWERYTAVSRPE